MKNNYYLLIVPLQISDMQLIWLRPDDVAVLLVQGRQVFDQARLQDIVICIVQRSNSCKPRTWELGQRMKSEAVDDFEDDVC